MALFSTLSSFFGTSIVRKTTGKLEGISSSPLTSVRSATTGLNTTGYNLDSIGFDADAAKFNSQNGTLGKQLNPNQANTTRIVTEEAGDDRVRLRPKSRAAWDIVFGAAGGDNILSVLHPEIGKTNGLVFPYTPMISYTYLAEWTPIPLSHTNYQTEAFNRAFVDNIIIAGRFTAQNQEEAIYTYAAIHFFRTMHKMYYGVQDAGSTDAPGLSGTPPPTLLLSGYGNGMFNDVPVVLKTFTHDLPMDVDYVPVILNRGKIKAKIPVDFMINITLGVQHDMIRIRDEFKLDDFRSGKLLSDNKGFL